MAYDRRRLISLVHSVLCLATVVAAELSVRELLVKAARAGDPPRAEAIYHRDKPRGASVRPELFKCLNDADKDVRTHTGDPSVGRVLGSLMASMLGLMFRCTPLGSGSLLRLCWNALLRASPISPTRS